MCTDQEAAWDCGIGVKVGDDSIESVGDSLVEVLYRFAGRWRSHDGCVLPGVEWEELLQDSWGGWRRMVEGCCSVPFSTLIPCIQLDTIG